MVDFLVVVLCVLFYQHLYLLYWLKICGSMFAQRANKVLRQFVALIDVAAHFANKSLLALCLWLGLYIILVIGISHGILIAHHPRLCH